MMLPSRVRAALREPCFSRPVLVLESDDWGAGDPAQADALHCLTELLARMRDADHQPAKMTLGVVGGIIDRTAWRAGHGYRRVTLADSSQASIVQAMREGIRAGVFALQWHGLEHYWPAALIAASDRPKVARWIMDDDAGTETLPDPLQSRWVNGAVLPTQPLEQASVFQAVAEEAVLLKELFGQLPEIAVPNTFVWGDVVEHAWHMHGVRWVVTCGKRYVARDAEGALVADRTLIANGDASATGVRYLVRDVYFEPARGHAPLRLAEALQTRARQGRPCLVESHRFNYVGTFSREGLSALEAALDAALQATPDLRFAASREVALAIETDSPLWIGACRPSQLMARLRQSA